MALINYANKEINAKIVYYGPGLSGKTTNIQYVYQKLKPEHRGRLITLPTQTDRTLFFDFLPVEIPNVRGFTTRFHLYTVPGQVFYNATRKMVLKGVDGVVFVADSQMEKIDDNIESFQNLGENLIEYGKSVVSLPIVLQFNKRDLAKIMSVDDLNKRLNSKQYPYFEAVATSGNGVMETLATISKLVLKNLKTSYDSQKILRYEGGVPEKEPAIIKERGNNEIYDVHLKDGAPANKKNEEILEVEQLPSSGRTIIERTRQELGVMGDFDDATMINNEHTSGGAGETPDDAFETPQEIPVVVIEQGETMDAEDVDLILGGEIERKGPASFQIPLTFQMKKIKKDVVLTINFEIFDSKKKKDLF